MLGAVYTHYTLHDKLDRMAPGIVFSLLLFTRLIIHRLATQREKRLKSTDLKQKSENETEEPERKTEEKEKIPSVQASNINQKKKKKN
jgi:uncharacterized membrane protein YdbT with pleckstrin-like domain